MGAFTELRQLVIDSLGDELGRYIFATEQEIPAIVIASNRRFPPPGTTISGLEVVIYPRVSSDLSGMLGGQLVKRETRLVLNQWDLDKDTMTAHDLLIGRIPDLVRIGPRILADGDRQTIESQTFYLSEAIVINWRSRK